MIHICPDEVGMFAAAVATVGALIRPVRDCVKCQALYLYKKLRNKA